MNVPFKIDLKNQVAVVTGGSGVLCSCMAKALAGEMAHFIDCIVNDTTPLIDGVDGAKTVATAWAAIESAANGGKPVAVRNEF